MIALDPQQTFDFSLDIDAAKPPEHRTIWTSRFLTGLQVGRIEELGQQSDADNLPFMHSLALLQEAAVIGLVRVRGPLVPDNTPAAEAIKSLTAKEIWELSVKKVAAARVSENDRKKSALQSASAAIATSAGTVPAGNV